MTRDNFFQRLIKLSKNAPTEKIRQSHKVSEAIKSEQIQILEDETGYLISSLSNPNIQYHIIKAGETYNQSCLKCMKCNICIHTFHCSCNDNIIKMNICKHIHACAREVYNSFDNDTLHIETNIEEQENMMQISLPYVNENKTTPNNDNNDIFSQTKLINTLGATNSYNDEQKDLIKKHLAKVIEIMNEGNKIQFQTVNNVNTQEKIESQIRLYSTKQKTIPKNHVSKPSINKTNAILTALENKNKSINIHSVFDHSYNV